MSCFWPVRTSEWLSSAGQLRGPGPNRRGRLSAIYCRSGWHSIRDGRTRPHPNRPVCLSQVGPDTGSSRITVAPVRLSIEIGTGVVEHLVMLVRPVEAGDLLDVVPLANDAVYGEAFRRISPIMWNTSTDCCWIPKFITSPWRPPAKRKRPSAFSSTTYGSRRDGGR